MQLSIGKFIEFPDPQSYCEESTFPSLRLMPIDIQTIVESKFTTSTMSAIAGGILVRFVGILKNRILELEYTVTQNR